MERILSADADVVFLQEVDRFKQFRNEMAKHGYEGAYGQKRGGAVDGVALFWKRGLGRSGDAVVIPLGFSVHVALAQRLVLGGKETICCVTHLKAGMNEKGEAARETQMANLLQALGEMQAAHEVESVIVAGDLNSHHADLTEPPVAAKVAPQLVQSGFVNAYASADDNRGFTTWAGWSAREVKATIDAIWHLPVLRCDAVLDYPSEEDVLQFPERLPNHAEPSDHVHIAACLSWPEEKGPR